MWLAERPAGRKHGAPAAAHRVPSCWLGPGSLPPSPHTSATLHKACARMVRCVMCCEMQQRQKQCAGMAIRSKESFPVRPRYFLGIISPPSGSQFHWKKIILHSKSLNVQSRRGLIFMNIKYCGICCNMQYLSQCLSLNFWINRCLLSLACLLFCTKFPHTGIHEVRRGTDSSGLMTTTLKASLLKNLPFVAGDCNQKGNYHVFRKSCINNHMQDEILKIK